MFWEEHLFPPKTNEYPMKNNGWKLEDKTFFPFEHGPFSGDILSFSGGEGGPII